MTKRSERFSDGIQKGRKDSMKSSRFKNNMNRLGGRGGLSLEAFANAKTKNQNYNPSIIKKQREFYENAKFVRKYKKSLKQPDQLNDTVKRRPTEGENKSNEFTLKSKKQRHSGSSLREVYEKKKEEEKKLQMEREAILQAKKEAKQEAEARRKALREKMLKKTKSGQPVMKYRIQHMLETLQHENNSS